MKKYLLKELAGICSAMLANDLARQCREVLRSICSEKMEQSRRKKGMPEGE